jgi:hypothetical protein
MWVKELHDDEQNNVQIDLGDWHIVTYFGVGGIHME